MKNLKKDYPNINDGMSQKWLERFEKSKNEKVVERLFDFLEERILEESKKLKSSAEDLTINVGIVNKNCKNYFQINLEKMIYNEKFDTWESAEDYPLEMIAQIKDYYKNYEETSMQEMLEDFLENVPEDLESISI